MIDWQACRVTFWLAASTTAACTLLALPIAWRVARSRSRWRPVVESIVLLPMVLPPTVLGFLLLLLFGRNGPAGMLWRQLFGTNLAFSFAGVLAALVVANLPFAVQPLVAGFSSVRPSLLEAAACLGHGNLMQFVRVGLPLSWNAVLAGALLVFAHTLGEFGVVLMVGGNIAGETRTLSVALFDEVAAAEHGRAVATAAFLLSASFALLLLLQWTVRRPGPMQDAE